MNQVQTVAPTGPGRASDMSDSEFVAAFETLTLPEDRFAHADHVRLAWIYLRRLPLVDAIARFRDGLKRFSAAHGAPRKYHETVTWAYLVLINERLHGADAEETWPEFAQRNPDLVTFREGALFDYYGPDLLDDELARHVFVLPSPDRRKRR